MTYPDDVIFDRLRDALRAEPVEPDDAAWAGLEASLAALATPGATPIRAVAGRRHGWRTSTLAVTLVSALAVSGVAAAAVATNTLPGPFRSIAYNLGLPVTSPGLYRAQQEVSTLRATLREHHGTRAHAIGESLAAHLRTLDKADSTSIEASADELLQEAGVSVPGLVAPTTIPGSDATDTSGDQGVISGSGEVGAGAGSSDSSGSTVTTTTLGLPLPTVPSLEGDN